MKRFTEDNSEVFYINGDKTILSSNHVILGDNPLSPKATSIPGAMARFGDSLLKFSKGDCSGSSPAPFKCPVLNIVPNVEGFNYRFDKGKNAAAKFLLAIRPLAAAKNFPLIDIDIVAHSMGFAYAQGFIEFVKLNKGNLNIKWNGYFIIAPENGCTGTVNVGDWQEIWQYGADERLTNGIPNTPIDQQDGVAPQCPVGNILNRRAFIPASAPKGFTESHLIVNYTWMFSTIKGANGYIRKR
jgi:hypothetical protein